MNSPARTLLRGLCSHVATVALDEAERAAVQRALSLFNGNISQAAEVLGVSRPTIYDLMSKHGLKA